MNKVYKFLITAGTAACLSTSAYAFSGWTIGVIGNDSEFTTTGTETEGSGDQGSGATNTNEVTSATITKAVDFGSAFLEYSGGNDVGGALTVGVEYIPGEASLGSKSRTDTDGDTADDADTGTYTGKAEVSDHWSLYAEPTLNLNSVFGVYGKVGVSRVTVKSLESIDRGVSSSAYGDEDAFGGMYGAGLRVSTPIGIVFKLEATETKYQSVEMQSGTGNKNTITGRPEQSSVRLAIGYKF